MHEFINRKFSFCFHIDPKLGYLMHISDNRGLKKHKNTSVSVGIKPSQPLDQFLASELKLVCFLQKCHLEQPKRRSCL